MRGGGHCDQGVGFLRNPVVGKWYRLSNQENVAQLIFIILSLPVVTILILC